MPAGTGVTGFSALPAGTILPVPGAGPTCAEIAWPEDIAEEARAERRDGVKRREAEATSDAADILSRGYLAAQSWRMKVDDSCRATGSTRTRTNTTGAERAHRRQVSFVQLHPFSKDYSQGWFVPGGQQGD
ncbi:unnamed protein product [Xylocopa violacea]|uniref:Uncharacterized protein n=1 Tax=Xylocopa violacea TaxID=135666 RepID=A0ABP1NSU1_XYLVO